MSGRRLLAVASCIIVMIALPGCPSGSNVAGTWQTFLDDNCDASVIGYYGFVLHANGSAEWHIGQVYLGSWALNGSTITVTFTTPMTAMFTGALSSDGTAITNGTFSIPGSTSGCFTAEKLEF